MTSQAIGDAPAGWDAIDAKLATIHGPGEPGRFAYALPDSGEPALQACSAYSAPGHWHYVTLGLSELYSHPGEVSGWGIELTMRVVRGRETAAPLWPFTTLHTLARHVHTSRTALRGGDRVDLHRPITGHPELPGAPATDQTVLALTVDAQLGMLRGPNGRVTFLQVTGVTPAEKARMAATSTEAVLAELARFNRLLIIDPRRA